MLSSGGFAAYTSRLSSSQEKDAWHARKRSPARQLFYGFTGGASATAASAVSIRKVNVSCMYSPTVESV